MMLVMLCQYIYLVSARAYPRFGQSSEPQIMSALEQSLEIARCGHWRRRGRLARVFQFSRCRLAISSNRGPDWWGGLRLALPRGEDLLGLLAR
jgi:hypothetical protein